LIPGVKTLAEYLRLSRDGSMWTAGVTINF